MNVSAPAVIQTALVDLERALARDGSHALMAASPSAARSSLLAALPQHLSGKLAAVCVSLEGVPEEGVCPAVLRALGREPGPDPEGQLRGLVRELCGRGSALALLVDDAGELPPGTLRRLGALASTAPGLRIALFLAAQEERDAGGTARVVAELGLGVQKIALHTAPQAPRRTAAPGEVGLPPALPTPPTSAWTRKVGAGAGIPVAPQRRPNERGRSLAVGAAVLLALGLGLGVVYGLPAPTVPLGAPRPATVAESPLPSAPLAPADPAVEPAPPDVTVGSAPDDAAVGSAPDETAPSVAMETAAAELMPVAPEPRTALEPAPAPQPLAIEPGPVVPTPPAALEPAPVAPQPPAALEAAPVGEPSAPTRPSAEPEPPVAAASPVLVKVNARPWARIEVDGRDVGVTPLGSVPLSRGMHRFRAHLPDGSVVERTVRIGPYRDRVTFP